ncbi:hypothetical protein G5B40_13845 [Pikeienuella piscinae]|uniref:DUF1127 domain-containing protein n=1 Tax=Pikeienuella piscinae TaxID=2748098 RepID=A0A7L5C039_9RHOB|nr:hypothetical protein [Pikeienuella piscinae]QIE56448.1 hypothetical protein G5B40_13845 [Pikeienuella piscinae]
MAFLTGVSTEPQRFQVALGVRAALRKIILWLSVARERRELAGLAYHRLDDIGVAPKAADSEAKRPFWAVRKRA